MIRRTSDVGLVLAAGVIDRPVAVGDAGDVGALLAAAQGDGQVTGGDRLAREELRLLAGGVQAQLLPHTSATSEWRCSPGWVPADSAITRPSAKCSVSSRAATERPPLRTPANTT